MANSLTDLEKAALLKKARLAKSLLEASDIRLREMDSVYDPERSPEGEWTNRSWYGDSCAGGLEGYSGYNTIYRVTLSGKSFVIVKKRVEYRNDSAFTTNHERNHPDGNCNCCGIFYYVFRSEGYNLATAYVNREKLEELLVRAKNHSLEALTMLYEELEYVKTVK